MANVKRWDILAAIRNQIKTIRQGGDVGGSFSTQTYTNTIGRVMLAAVDVTNFADAEFPAVMILDAYPTSFQSQGDEESYEAVWTLAIVLIVKDPRGTEIRNSTITERLETLFRDIDLAMHVFPNALNAADVGVSLVSYEPEPLADPRFGMAVAKYEIRYQHLSV